MTNTSEAFKAHVDELVRQSDGGDTFAEKCLAALALLTEGWRYGDPDPTDPPDGGGETVIDLSAYRTRLAA